MFSIKAICGGIEKLQKVCWASLVVGGDVSYCQQQSGIHKKNLYGALACDAQNHGGINLNSTNQINWHCDLFDIPNLAILIDRTEIKGLEANNNRKKHLVLELAFNAHLCTFKFNNLTLLNQGTVVLFIFFSLCYSLWVIIIFEVDFIYQNLKHL